MHSTDQRTLAQDIDRRRDSLRPASRIKWKTSSPFTIAYRYVPQWTVSSRREIAAVRGKSGNYDAQYRTLH